jgi:hypothetical protein
MAELEDIVQRISVEGIGEIGSVANTMAHDFEAAFEKISRAAEGGATGLEVFGTGVVGITVAVAAATAALGMLESKSIHTGVELQTLGEAFGTTAAGVQGLEKAFAGFGVGPEKLQRAIQRTVANVANSMAEIHRMQRTAEADQESASEGIVSAEIRVQEAKNKTKDVSTEQSLKLRSDVVSVAEAYQTLQFAAADSASAMSNAFLGVASAALAVRSAVNQLEDAMRSTSVEAANLGANSAGITAAEARQRVTDLESGHVDQAANKELQLRRARATRDQAELGKKDADYKKETAPRDLELKQDQAQLGLSKAMQGLRDAMLGLTKAMTTQGSAASPEAKAQLGYDQARFKQYQDVRENAQNLPARRAANDLASALTHLKEATEKDYDVKLKNLDRIAGAMRGEDTGINLPDVSLSHERMTVTAEAEKKAGGEPSGLQAWDAAAELLKNLSKGTQTAIMGPMLGARQGQGVEELVKAINNLNITLTARKGEKDPTNLQAPDNARNEEALKKEAETAAASRNVSLKAGAQAAPAYGGIMDFVKGAVDWVANLGHSADTATPQISTLGTNAETTAGSLGRLQAAFDNFKMPSGGGSGGKEAPSDNFDARFTGHAGGGDIRGPGSGTSDSILARLSNGEFVTRAAAVQKYGSEFFHRVNDMTFPGFAMGGLVSSAMRLPSGSAPATSTVNLSIDGRTFGSLRGSKSTVDDLSSFAIARQTSAAGNNPSWMK